jgi:hypothetical protein
VRSDYINPETGELVKGSNNFEKSTYFYYRTELQRWEGIRESFRTIASDAERYMHERNMLGQDGGPGYLNQAKDTSGKVIAGDPYLMTGAELNFELASRDRDFWEKRLQIAKSVMDYAYPENGKREDAAATVERKNSARGAMESAKAAYDNALAAARAILEDLKIIQGVRPESGKPGDGTEAWNRYENSIEYISQKYQAAAKALEKTGEELEARRRALIILENGRDASFLADEIENLEKNILSSDLKLREARGEYYNKLRENEQSASNAVFAGNYSAAVHAREEAKLKNSLITGELNDENLALWSSNIINSKTLVWGDTTAADGNAALLKKLSDEFISAAGDEKIKLRGDLQAYLGNLQRSFAAEFAASDRIFSLLKDRAFDPGEYLKTQYEGTAVYTEYADYSINALKIIDEGFQNAEDAGNSRSYETIYSYLQGLLAGKSFVYGGDNTFFIEHYAALKIFEDRYRGLTPESWEGSRSRIEDEIETALEIKALHENRGALT